MRARRLMPALLAAALSFAADLADARPLNVVASFTVLADVVKQIGGETVRVTSLVPAGGDPHTFEPSPDHARIVKAADLVIVSGDGLEPWFARLVRASGYPGRTVVASEGIEVFTTKEDGRSVVDAHVWNSASNVVAWVANVEKALRAVDPDGAATYAANAARYGRELRDLDAYARDRIAGVPKERRRVLTSHDAFGYFGRAYGVTFLSPLGVSTESEASAADVARLIRQIRREKVRVYFIESSGDPRLAKQIADATGAEPGGALYVESLSGADGPAPTYARMFRHNVDQLVGAMSK